MRSKYFINTDTLDMENCQIGVHTFNRDRFLNVSVNHMRTKESVTKATILAEEIAYFLNNRYKGVTYGKENDTSRNTSNVQEVDGN